MITSNLSETSLFIFAHQDDEVGVFHAIQDQIHKGNNVKCIYLTSGSATNNANIVAIRNNESFNVLISLGVHSNDIYFSDQFGSIEDGSLMYNISALVEKINIFVEKYLVKNIYSHAYEGGHPDHDAAYVICCLLSKKHLNVNFYQFPLYNAHGCIGPFFKVFNPISENGAVQLSRINASSRIKYLALILNYRSQFRTWVGLLPFVVWRYCVHPYQSIQSINHARIYNRPHESRLYYEYRGYATYDQFADVIKYQISNFAI